MTHHDLMLRDGWSLAGEERYVKSVNGLRLEVWRRESAWCYTVKGARHFAEEEGFAPSPRHRMAAATEATRIARAAPEAPAAPDDEAPLDARGRRLCWQQSRVDDYRCHLLEHHTEPNHLMMIPDDRKP